MKANTIGPTVPEKTETSTQPSGKRRFDEYMDDVSKKVRTYRALGERSAGSLESRDISSLMESMSLDPEKRKRQHLSTLLDSFNNIFNSFSSLAKIFLDEFDVDEPVPVFNAIVEGFTYLSEFFSVDNKIAQDLCKDSSPIDNIIDQIIEIFYKLKVLEELEAAEQVALIGNRIEDLLKLLPSSDKIRELCIEYRKFSKEIFAERL